MKLRIIVDNVSSSDIRGEWGFSALVEFGGKKILLDTGASRLFLKNMKKLDIDVSDIDYAVLSHAHFDHANGFPVFLDNNKKAKLYLREGTSANCYHKKYFINFYIGIPRRLPKKYADRIEIVSGNYKLMDGVYLIPHKTEGLAKIGIRESMFRKTEHGWIPDDFSHEQSLVFDTDKGLVILNSCSHGGAAATIDEIKAAFPKHQ